MARYIDADEFFQTLGFYEQSFDENRDFSARQTILQIMHELEHAPTADVVEVVRCKNCIYAEKHYDTTHLIGNTYYHSGAPTRLLYITCKNRKGKLEERDFCSCGERNLLELPTD